MSTQDEISPYPLTHPDFRYRPSRNPYWKKLRDHPPGPVFCDHDCETQSGKWAETFSRLHGAGPRPLHVEIGCNAGHVIVEWARRDPGSNYIGIDYKFKTVHRAAEKGAKHSLKNLIFLRGAAERLPFMFGPGEIDFLYLYFPDPWSKKSQWKNRFINEKRLRALAPLMKPKGVFHIKTDHPEYFDWMLEAISRVGDLWEPREQTRDLHAGHLAPQTLEIPDVTLFERIFIKEGIKIHSVKLLR